MNRHTERGMVLVACMLILALLSLLGASSLFTATLDTQLVGNEKVNKEAFYAAEAALEVGAGKVMADFQNSLRPYRPAYTWQAPQGSGAGDPFANPFNTYTTQYRLGNALNPSNRASEPQPILYATAENGQQIMHLAYTYSVEAESSGPRGAARMTETLRVLETPLVQYFAFFGDDLSWHPTTSMESWGRVHTNGNLFFAPLATLTFQDYTSGVNPQFVPNQLTVSGAIRYGSYLAQNGGMLARASSTVRVRVRNLGTAPAGAGDFENVTTDITSANQGAEEARFRDAAGTYHVRVGVNPLPTPSSQTLVPGGFYDTEAASPRRDRVDGMRIFSDNGGLHIFFTPFGGGAVDVTSLVRNYQAAAGTNVNFATWPADALTRADTTTALSISDPANRPLIPGTIVYSPESIVGTDEANAINPVFYTAFRGANRNPNYPCILERQDGREGVDVDFTVIDLQRLQLWYRDYLDWLDGVWGNQPNLLSGRRLLIYATRTNATTKTAGALQAIKLIGSGAGRTRQAADRQSAGTLLVSTTFVTDCPLYLDGDFNAPGASAPASSMAPGGFGCALLCDAVTLLSNNWGAANYNGNGGAAGPTPASQTAFNAAIFAGRYDFRSGGGGGEEAGIQNFTRFLENWNGQQCFATGCLINLWFSTKAVGPHGAGYFSPPNQRFGWDVAFANPTYWPPYVPSIYNVERVAWRAE